MDGFDGSNPSKSRPSIGSHVKEDDDDTFDGASSTVQVTANSTENRRA